MSDILNSVLINEKELKEQQLSKEKSITSQEEQKSYENCKAFEEEEKNIINDPTIPFSVQSGDFYFEEGYKKFAANENEEAYQLFYKGVLLNHTLCQKYYLEALATGGFGIEKNEDEADKMYLTLAYKGDWDAICNFNEIDPNILKKNTVQEAFDYYKNLGT